MAVYDAVAAGPQAFFAAVAHDIGLDVRATCAQVQSWPTPKLAIFGFSSWRANVREGRYYIKLLLLATLRLLNGSSTTTLAPTRLTP